MTRLSRDGAIEALESGRVLLMDTDTLPGLHALASAEGAAGRIAALKGHPPERPYLLLVASVEAGLVLGEAAQPDQEAELRRLWPGPLTALLRPRPGTPPEWTWEGRSVGIRVPGDARLRDLLAGLSGPLFSTSANRAGEAPARRLDEAEGLFPGLDSLPLDPSGRAGVSTIVDFTVSPPRLVRPGLVPFEPGGAA